ncbi:MAG: hypothetical protein LBN99_07670 [Oscillospiraceae bacterium]|jgi:hypothetical protein|nr:hypothetical protein [Oscillospiraceae bacterium]
MAKSRGKGRRKKSRTSVFALVTVAVIAVLFIGATLVNSNFLRRRMTALEAAGVKLTVAEYNCFYIDAVNDYNNYVSSYYPDDAASMLPDNSRPLTAQIYDTSTGQTWAEFYDSMAIENARQTAAVYSDAQAKGYKLSEEDETALQTQLDQQETDIKTYYGLKSMKEYVRLVYGGVSTKKDYLRVARLRYTINAYAKYTYDGFSYSQEQIDSYYAENKDGLDTFTYRYFIVQEESVSYSDFDTDEAYATAKSEAYAAAKAKADGYLDAISSAVASEVEFVVSAADNDASEEFTDTTLVRGFGEQVTAAISDWIKAPERVTGNLAVIPATEDPETNTGFYVVYFMSRSANDYLTANMRQLVVTPEAVSQSDYTGEDGQLDVLAYDDALGQAQAAAKEKAEALYAQWQESGATEDGLVELMAGNSSDATEGGLYENVERNRSGQDITVNNWLFVTDRKAGDHTLFQDTNDAWVIVYFIDNGPLYSDFLAEARLREADYTAWQTAYDSVEVKTRWAFKLRANG